MKQQTDNCGLVFLNQSNGLIIVVFYFSILLSTVS